MSIQAIETMYNGYRFRSRLEARWAVFFDTLGIKYEYEKEGYSLDGVRYLPDFWLPQLKYWIEIKGQELTREETNKACLLSLHTNQRVYIFPGEIGVPDIENHYYIDRVNEYASWRNGILFEPYDMSIVARHPTFTCGIRRVFSRVRNRYLQRCEEHDDNCPYYFEVWNHRLASVIYRQELFLLYLDSFKLRLTQDKRLQFIVPVYEDEEQHKYLGRVPILLPPLIKEHEQEFLQLLSNKPPLWEWGIGSVWALHGDRGYVWGHCTECYRLKIVHKGSVSDVLTDECPCGGIYIHDSPRLVAAYNAARQARFEHGETPTVKTGR